MKKIFVLTSIGMLSASLFAVNWATAQNPTATSPGSRAIEDVLIRTTQEQAPERYYNLAVTGFLGSESQNAVDKALKALKSAEDDASRRQAEGDLKSALEADYDARLEGYEKHLDNLEAELARMRDQLTKRRAAKSEMVELRLQVLQAEADDLGWPSEFNSRGGNRFFRSRSSDPFGAIWTTNSPDSETVDYAPPAPATPAAPAVRVRGSR